MKSPLKHWLEAHLRICRGGCDFLQCCLLCKPVIQILLCPFLWVEVSRHLGNVANIRVVNVGLEMMMQQIKFGVRKGTQTRSLKAQQSRRKGPPCVRMFIQTELKPMD